MQGLVRSLGGTIVLTSELNKSSTFQVLLPCAESTDGVSGHAVSAAGELAMPPQRGKILVVEDECHLRQGLVKMHRKAGFKVFEAADGPSAIDLLRADGGKLDVILLDMTIPGASSAEVVAQAANAKPDIKVILTSAYSPTPKIGARSRSFPISPGFKTGQTFQKGSARPFSACRLFPAFRDAAVHGATMKLLLAAESSPF